MARVLHDDLQQQLFAVQLQLQMLAEDLGDTDFLEAITDLVSHALTTTRRLTVDLSPPVLQGEGLTEAVNWLGVHMQERYDLSVEVDAGDKQRVEAEDMRVLLFQLVRELLFNVVKHADVDEARVILSEDDHDLVIRVEDDGTGFDTSVLRNGNNGTGFGLPSVVERLRLFGGRLTVDSAPGHGTRCTVRVPLTAVHGEAEGEQS
jgi:signal transduction histidine kinase